MSAFLTVFFVRELPLEDAQAGKTSKINLEKIKYFLENYTLKLCTLEKYTLEIKI